MDIKEVKAEKKKLEETIVGLLTKFTMNTGCMVTAVHDMTIDASTVSKIEVLYTVDLDIEIM